MTSPNRHLLALAFVSLLALGACSSVPETKTERSEVNINDDPLESVNRVTFDVNDFLDRLLIRPMAELYRVMIPPPLRDRIAAILKNMDEPVIMANNMLQGEFSSAGTSFSRLVINTTLGGGGMFDVANEFKLYRQTGDFGQTLHTWGVGSGPYIVLPLFGPSTARDAVGLGVDSVMSPWQYIVAIGNTQTKDTFFITDMAGTALSKREANIEALDALHQGSLDFYAQMRSVYRQYRAKQLGEPLANDSPMFDDYDADTSIPVKH